jgi:hypothetical protein
MYTLKSIVQRGSLFGAAAAIVAAVVVPAASVFADALNPLTERSLRLTSSAPGWQDTDGAGNSETNPNAWTGPEGNYYSLPGSGPNGKKTGETFSFRVSTDSAATDRPIKAFTLQYCTTAAGLCQAPGDNQGDKRDSSRETNEVANANKRSDLSVNYPTGTSVAGTDYKIYLNDVEQSSGWVITTSNKEDDGFQANGTNEGRLTGKDNFITLTNTSEDFKPAFNDKITIVFVASSDRHITNPGSNAFFVKMNTYDSETPADHVPLGEHNIDGGVTVANVMTDSIHITTKVLETMAFSVGVQNPDTQNQAHGSCDAMQVINGNRLELGNINAERSLETGQAYDTNSYWRLSSNSSGGAVVYYSGDTLRNTVGDEIQDMVNKQYSIPGTEQFGLAVVNAGTDTGADKIDDVNSFPSNWITPNIAPLTVATPYSNGDIAAISNADTSTNAQFSFKQTSKSVPEILASNATGEGGSGGVISCATAKVRYIGNIAADTPAGVYTTKINYLAAPQY